LGTSRPDGRDRAIRCTFKKILCEKSAKDILFGAAAIACFWRALLAVLSRKRHAINQKKRFAFAFSCCFSEFSSFI